MTELRHRKLERMQTGTKNGMNMRLGRIGAQEGVSVLSIALTLGGVFTLETKTLYEHGNSAYLTVPAAVLISLVVFILLLKSMQKAHVRDLYRLLEKGYGNAWAAMLSIPIMHGAIILREFIIFPLYIQKQWQFNALVKSARISVIVF